MPTFMVISSHSPEYCPEFNEKVRKATLEAMSKLDVLLKKPWCLKPLVWKPSKDSVWNQSF